MQFSRSLARWFPVPQILSPHAYGVDITDASVKWLSLERSGTQMRVGSFGNQPIPQGVVQMGAVHDPHTLAGILKEVKKKAHVFRAHAALPEEAAFVFSMHVPTGSSRTQIMNMIEFEMENRVPIPPAQAVYDFDTIAVRDDQGEEIAVTVFPRELADGYSMAFSEAGITLVSLEIEARSIARTVSSPHDPVTLLVDCGKARTGIAILKAGIPIFTSTVEVGGDHMSHAIMETLSIDEAEAERFKNEQGLMRDGDPSRAKATEALEKICALLADEIARHYRFWDTRRSEKGARETPVARIYLVGGSANVRGLLDYIAGKTHAATERPNVWHNVFSFDEYIPPIEYRTSFQYATAIGLAMRGI